MDNNSSGQTLKAAREAKGISLETVHEATKIPLDVLRAIEEGYKVRTLSPFYLRGFLKIYAQYLDIELTNLSQPPQTPVGTKISKRTAADKPFLAAIRSKITVEQQEALIKAGIILILLFALFKLVGFILHVQKVPVKNSQLERRMDENKKTKKEKTKEENKSQPKGGPQASGVTTPARTVAASAPMASTGKVTSNIVLTVRAQKNTWLRVVGDGSVVFQAVLKKGIVETWLANDTIEISGKNINQLEFELNGKMIGTLGRQDRLASKVVITKDGLSVKQ